MIDFITNRNKERYLHIVMLLGILYGFAVLILGSYYTWPNLETINESRANVVGIWNSWTQSLIFMDGRYTTNLLHAINPLSLGWMAGFKIMPIIGLVLFTGSFTFFISTFFDKSNKCYLFSFLFVSIHFALSPSITYEFFNMIAGFMYLWGGCFWLIWVASTYRWLSSDRKSVAYFMLAAFFLVASVGSNEMFLIVDVFTLIAISWFGFKQDVINKALPLLVIGGMSIAFFFACSGSIQRIGYDVASHQYSHLTDEFVYFLKHYFQATKVLFTQSFLLFPLLLLVSRNITLRKEVQLFLDKRGNMIFISFMALISIFLMTVPFYLFKTSNGIFPERIFSLVLIYIQLFFTFWVAWKFSKQNLFLSNILSSCLLLALVFGNNNYTSIIAEWRSGKLQEFHSKQLFNHEKLAKAAKSKQPIKVVEIPVIVQTSLIVHDPSKDFPGDFNWYNRILENYYELDEVRFSSDGKTKISYIQKGICYE